MEKFLNLITQISQNPAMYAGSVRMDLIRAHLSGYEMGLIDCDVLKEKYSLSAFTDWLRLSTGKENEWWDAILVDLYHSEENAISRLPEKYTQFIQSVGI